MSYTTINQCANDIEFQGRVTACIAQEGRINPGELISSVLWPVASANDIAAAYEYAINSGNEHPGGDATVITDQMILSAVQAHLPPPPPVSPS